MMHEHWMNILVLPNQSTTALEHKFEDRLYDHEMRKNPDFLAMEWTIDHSVTYIVIIIIYQ